MNTVKVALVASYFHSGSRTNTPCISINGTHTRSTVSKSAGWGETGNLRWSISSSIGWVWGGGRMLDVAMWGWSRGNGDGHWCGSAGVWLISRSQTLPNASRIWLRETNVCLEGLQQLSLLLVPKSPYMRLFLFRKVYCDFGIGMRIVRMSSSLWYLAN